MFAIELHGVKPLLTLLQTASSHQLLVGAVRVLANIAYNNPLTANSALIGGAGEVLLEVLEAVDVTSNRQRTADVASSNEAGAVIAHAVLSALSNMCNSEANQTHIGNMNGILEAALRIVQFGQ